MSKEDCVTPSDKHAAPEGGFDFIVCIALLTAYLEPPIEERLGSKGWCRKAKTNMK